MEGLRNPAEGPSLNGREGGGSEGGGDPSAIRHRHACAEAASIVDRRTRLRNTQYVQAW
ncbi:hypothetical protein GCM10023171_22270 [Microbacterium panaciterrae]|uniref:Uncharacterized protein n=1 Tax=Microbacterium panaciterrae TaxID=985759 RepID=A0ABP8PGW3_9MICO